METKTYRVTDGSAVLHLTLEQLLEGASVTRTQMQKRLQRSQRDLARLRESPSAARARQVRADKMAHSAMFAEHQETKAQPIGRGMLHRNEWQRLQRRS